MKLKSVSKIVSYIAVTALFVACGNSTENENISTSDTSSTMNKEKDARAQKVFSAIPSPVESAELLKAAGAKYDSKYLNPIENATKYSTIKSQAINLGIYGSDLSFTSIYDQNQESMVYLNCTNKLAAALKINEMFDEKTTSRIEENMSNKDSLINIINESFWKADAYLRGNGQPGISSLIVAGGWIEGLYIATSVANVTKNEAIISKIASQKTALNDLILLLDAYKAENAGISEVMTNLNEIKTIFDGIADTKITPEQLKQLTDKTAEIRNKLIQ